MAMLPTLLNILLGSPQIFNLWGERRLRVPNVARRQSMHEIAERDRQPPFSESLSKTQALFSFVAATLLSTNSIAHSIGESAGYRQMDELPYIIKHQRSRAVCVQVAAPAPMFHIAMLWQSLCTGQHTKTSAKWMLPCLSLASNANNKHLYAV